MPISLFEVGPSLRELHAFLHPCCTFTPGQIALSGNRSSGSLRQTTADAAKSVNETLLPTKCFCTKAAQPKTRGMHCRTGPPCLPTTGQTKNPRRPCELVCDCFEADLARARSVAESFANRQH